MSVPSISQRAFDMTVAEEVTSKAYYERHYTHPEWPGLSSGVTIAIGYDLGQASRNKIAADWRGLVSEDMLIVMMSCAGITGNAAKIKCAEVKSQIDIPWDAAIKVFANRDVPSWTAAVLRAVPGSNKLNGDLLGVLFDLAYNRGCSFGKDGDRYREMRGIKNDVMTDHLSAVPGELESMKRLWPNTVGLRRRCDHRIGLWKSGMNNPSSIDASVAPTPTKPDPEVPLNEGTARTKPPATSNAQNGTAGAVVIGGAAATVEAARTGLIGTPGVIFAGFLVVLAAITIWAIWYKRRNPS